MINNVTEISLFYLLAFLKEGFVAIDATCGNGFDTLNLAEKVGKTGRVYAFDVQKEAITNTKKILQENNLSSSVKVILDSHENILEYVKEKIDCCVFNLGYLPSSNKEIKTNYVSTIKALEKSMSILKKGGIISICAYVGHEGGQKEYEEIIKYLSTKSKKEFNIIEIHHLGRKETSPKLIIIEKNEDYNE